MRVMKTASEELALAQMHDAAGRHDDAINALARATQAGDIEAMTRLGKRLTVGDRAPLLPNDGVGFLIDAANRGGAEAPAKLAFLAATGAYVPQSWSQAIDALIAAAERGFGPARAQLQLLGAAAQNESFAAPPRNHWRRLGAAIDIQAWRSAVPVDTLNESPAVRSCPDLVAPSVCEWLIERSRDNLERATVYDAIEGQDTTHEIRTNSTATFNLMTADFVCALVQARLAATANVPASNLEAPAVLHYEVGQQIDDHYDFVDPRTPNYAQVIGRQGQRMITFLIYLNEDYDGGETDFPTLGVSYRGPSGAGLFFVNALADGSPDLRAVHAGRPPTRGRKWVLSQFIRDRPVLHTRS